MHGDSYVSGFFENNPPLSIWIHVPPVLLGMAGIPLWHAAALFFGLLIVFSLWLSCKIVQRWDFLTEGQHQALLLGFLTGVTIVPSVSFGERDHLIILGLMPLALAQLSMTWNVALPKPVQYMALAFGSILILLKPHFGIIPAALLLHRMIRHKKLFIRDADFLFLAVTALAYVASVYIFVPEYIHNVLPVALKTYIGGKNPEIAIPELIMNFVMISIFLGLEIFSPQLKGRARDVELTLFYIALLCLVPYAIQLKGFYYHLLPALGFFYAGLGLFIQGYAAQYVKRDSLKPLVATAIIFAMAYGTRPLLLNYPTYQDYLQLPFARNLQENCKKPCVFFAFNDNIEIMPQTAIYTNSTIASRFPTLWMLPAIYHKRNMTDDEAKALKHDLAVYLAEDLNRYKPSTLYIMSNIRFEADKPFDFAEYFSDDPDFRKAIKPYRKAGNFEMNRRDYLRGTALDRDDMMEYDIYKRP